MATENAHQFTFRVQFDGTPDQDIALRAYLFSSNGHLLSSAPVQKEEVSFDVKGEVSGTPRIFIAPQVDDKTMRVKNIADLARLKAYEPVLNIGRDKTFEILPIPAFYWRWWCWKFCRVRGRVVKDFNFNGMVQEKAICHARINIYEVDKICFWINKIPNHIIDRIKKNFVDGPVDPHPGDPVENMGVIAERNIFSAKQFNVSTAVLPVEVRSKLIVKDNELVRKAMVDHIDLLRPYFCLWPWFYPYFYKSDLLTTVYSDTNGYFDTSFLHFYCCHSGAERFINNCCDNEPDIYFTIDYQVNGIWTSVYKPCLPTSTIWNYACGSDVTLRITDPRVPWGCHNQVQGSTVWVKSIGGGASVTHIEQSDSFVHAPAYNDVNFKPLPSAAFKKIGLSDASFDGSPNTYGDNRRPFGGTVRFVVQFGNAFPTNGIKYYRWSYLKTAQADLSATGNAVYKAIVMPELRKPYQYSFLDAGGVLRPGGTASIKLGPQPAVGMQDNLFLIPPNLLPGAAAPFLTNPAMEINPWWDYDTDTISFDTNTLEGDGLYDFKLELFDATGNAVEISKTAFNIPVGSFPNPDWDSTLGIWKLAQQAPDDYLSAGSTAVVASSYHMKVRIDNNPAEGNIAMVQLLSGGNYVPTAANCCGFVQYDPSQFNNENLLKIAFEAKQMHNFADLSFGIQRGTCVDPTQTTATNTNAMVMGDTSNSYTRDGNWIFEKTFSPSTLLGTCSEEQKAAFAESLTIQPLAITGDGQAFPTVSLIAAFAIEPITP